MAGFTSGFAEFMSRRMQRVHHKIDVFRALANFEEQNTLRRGDTVHRIYKTLPRVQNYSRGTAMTIGAHTETDESLVVDQAFVAPFYVDDLDQLQSNFNLRMEFGMDMALKLGNKIDGSFLAEVANADHTIDDSDMNPSTGTSGNGFTLTSSNVKKLFLIAKRKLDRANIAQSDRFVVLSAAALQELLDYLGDKATMLGDSVSLNGRVMEGKFMGFEIFTSNATYWSAELLVGSVATADDTIVVNTVTWTAKATPASAGEFDIAGDADAQRTIIANMLNGSDTGKNLATGYFEVSDANRALLDGVTATNDGANSVDLVAEGLGPVAVSETLTAGADVWTEELQLDHIMFGRKKATDMVVQKRPNIEIKDVPDKLGKNVIPWTLFGKKTFDEGDAMLVNAKRRSDKD